MTITTSEGLMRDTCLIMTTTTSERLMRDMFSDHYDQRRVNGSNFSDHYDK